MRKVSKRMQKKRKANMRTIGIVVCIIVIATALVVIFMPSNNNNSNKSESVASTSQTTNTTVINNNANAQVTNSITNTVVSQNTIANATNNIDTTNTITSNSKVTTNSNTITNNTQTSNNNQTTNNNSQEKKEENSSSGWSLFNWGNNDSNNNKDISQDRAKEIAVQEFAKLGENVNKNDLTVYELTRNDGLLYYYIKSSKNTCEVRKQDAVVTRLNAQVVNQ